MEGLPVNRELRAVLAEARRSADVSYSRVAVELGQGENSVRKFERGDSGPRFSQIDEWVTAYATTTGVPPSDLWARAMKRAKAASSGEPGGERSQRHRL